MERWQADAETAAVKTYVYRRPWSDYRRRKRIAVAGKAPGAYTITAGVGTFTVSGQAVGLRAARVISAQVGQLFLTGNDVALVHGTPGAYTIPAGVGSFALTGQTVSLTVARKLSVAAGSFTLTGQSVGLLMTRRLSAGVGEFVLSGQSVGLTASSGGESGTPAPTFHARPRPESYHARPRAETFHGRPK